MLPLPSFLLLTVIEFYLLHTLNELNDFTLFSSRLIETLDVEFAAKAHKRQYPNDMKSITAEEYQKNQRTIVTKDTGKYKEIDNGKRIFTVLPIKNDLMREWSPIRCIMSPVIFVSK